MEVQKEQKRKENRTLIVDTFPPFFPQMVTGDRVGGSHLQERIHPSLPDFSFTVPAVGAIGAILPRLHADRQPCPSEGQKVCLNMPVGSYNRFSAHSRLQFSEP